MALTTDAQVCNLALGLVGQQQLLDSLDEATTEAQMCRAFYASTRDFLLQQWPWKFAQKRTALALSAEERDGWALAYSAPVDMMTEAPCHLWSGHREEGAGQRLPFAVELNDASDGLLILCDVPGAQLIYTAKEVPVLLWSPAFIQAVATHLAVALAGALAVKPELMLHLQQSAYVALLRAKTLSANSASSDRPADAEWIRVRGE